MNRGCDTCQYIDTNAEQEPCVSCVRNYVDKWERQSYEHLINPLKRLAKIQIEKGNAEAVGIYGAVMMWIKEEGDR